MVESVMKRATAARKSLVRREIATVMCGARAGRRAVKRKQARWIRQVGWELKSECMRDMRDHVADAL
jgi:hypothetical protein